MNKQRRSDIDRLVSDLQGIQSALQDSPDFAELAGTLGDCYDAGESLRDEEQEYFDNMPESFQASEKGDNAQTAIDHLQEAVDSLQEAQELLEDHKDDGVPEPGVTTEARVADREALIEEIAEKLDEAISSLNEASA